MRRAYATFERPPAIELYDLAADPHEFENLAGDPAHEATSRRLLARLRLWQEEIRDPLAERSNRDSFMAEQARRRDGSHRKRGFVWPYLERFRRYRKESSPK